MQKPGELTVLERVRRGGRARKSYSSVGSSQEQGEDEDRETLMPTGILQTPMTDLPAVVKGEWRR